MSMAVCGHEHTGRGSRGPELPSIGRHVQQNLRLCSETAAGTGSCFSSLASLSSRGQWPLLPLSCCGKRSGWHHASGRATGYHSTWSWSCDYSEGHIGLPTGGGLHACRDFLYGSPVSPVPTTALGTWKALQKHLWNK